VLEEKAIVRNLNIGGKFYFQVPPEIIAKKEKLTSEAFLLWRDAREKNNFEIFLPSLKQLIAIDQIIAKHVGYKDNVYDALLDMYEPELTSKFVKQVFDKVKPELVKLVKKIQSSKKYKTDFDAISGKHLYAVNDQKSIGDFAMKKMGFDFQAGRVDVSAHPFTTQLDRYDIRLTAAFLEKDFRSSYTAYMHETGHALYEQGVDPEYSETPLEGGVSLGIHEALSRFWENMVGRNPKFITFMTQTFQEQYPKQLKSVSADELIHMFHIVKPSFIRIEADEVTYTLHIILRFEMEYGLINGTIKPEDAAKIWKEKFQESFGITPPTDSQGVLQDVHWSYGAFGYFPSYALGNFYGAQFLAKMKKQFSFDEELSQGKLEKVHAFLKDEIHQYGSLYLPADLVKKVTGESLDPTYFIEYLNQKYEKIYP
jgi:carboxypeptidase Taq